MMLSLANTEIEIPPGAIPMGVKVWFKSDPILENGRVCRKPDGSPIMDTTIRAAEVYVRMVGFCPGWSWVTGNVHYRTVSKKEEKELVSQRSLKKWTNGKQIWHEPKNIHLRWATEVKDE